MYCALHALLTGAALPGPAVVVEDHAVAGAGDYQDAALEELPARVGRLLLLGGPAERAVRTAVLLAPRLPETQDRLQEARIRRREAQAGRLRLAPGVAGAAPGAALDRLAARHRRR